MSRKSLPTVFAACFALWFTLLLGQANAQVITSGWQGSVVVPGQPIPQGQFVAPPQTFMPGQFQNPIVQGQVIIPGQFQNQVYVPGQVMPGQYYPYPYGYQRPSVPVGVTPNQVTGWNPQTGGLNTSNSQVNNTFYDPGRNMSQSNNTRRFERRPVYGTNGQVTGYQEGWVWNNTFTGQEHGNLQTYTPNQQGGVHEGNIAYSVAPGDESPAQNSPQTQTQQFNPQQPNTQQPAPIRHR